MERRPEEVALAMGYYGTIPASMGLKMPRLPPTTGETNGLLLQLFILHVHGMLREFRLAIEPMQCVMQWVHSPSI